MLTAITGRGTTAITGRGTTAVTWWGTTIGLSGRTRILLSILWATICLIPIGLLAAICLMPIPWMRPDGLLRLDWHRSSAAHPKFCRKRSQLFWVETVSQKRKNVGQLRWCAYRL